MPNPSIPTDHGAERVSEAGAPAVPDDFGGLRSDAAHLVDRRGALRWLGVLGVAGVATACSGGSGTSASSSSTAAGAGAGSGAGGSTVPSTGRTAAGSGTTAVTAAGSSGSTPKADGGPGAPIPDETEGPFPADGSNGPNLLTDGAVVRADIRNSIGGKTGTAEGVPCTVRLTVVDAKTGAALAGRAVYVWHCTADGRYSIYEIPDQNYLRGVQVTDDAGRLAFTTVFPGCYPGRWPHVHFEIYDSLDRATAGSRARKTSQLAFPQADCEVVYRDRRYGNSASNLSRLSLATDMVFADGWADQLATVAGDATSGTTASLLVRV